MIKNKNINKINLINENPDTTRKKKGLRKKYKINGKVIIKSIEKHPDALR